MHFNCVFDYHSHICKMNNMAVTWLLLTVSLLFHLAGLIYLHNCRLTGGGIGFEVKKNTHMRLYGHCYLIFWFPENINISLIELSVVLSHTVCMHQKCSLLLLRAEGRKSQTTDQTFYFCDRWIQTILYIYTYICSI